MLTSCWSLLVEGAIVGRCLKRTSEKHIQTTLGLLVVVWRTIAAIVTVLFTSLSVPGPIFSSHVHSILASQRCGRSLTRVDQHPRHLPAKAIGTTTGITRNLPEITRNIPRGRRDVTSNTAGTVLSGDRASLRTGPGGLGVWGRGGVGGRKKTPADNARLVAPGLTTNGARTLRTEHFGHRYEGSDRTLLEKGEDAPSRMTYLSRTGSWSREAKLCGSQRSTFLKQAILFNTSLELFNPFRILGPFLNPCSWTGALRLRLHRPGPVCKNHTRRRHRVGLSAGEVWGAQ